MDEQNARHVTFLHPIDLKLWRLISGGRLFLNPSAASQNRALVISFISTALQGSNFVTLVVMQLIMITSDKLIGTGSDNFYVF